MRACLAFGCLHAAGAILDCRGEELRLVQLETGHGVLNSRQEPAFLTSTELGPAFHFRLTFETDEIPSPNFFADSITVSLFGSDPNRTAALVTLDVFGLNRAPSNPGGFFLEQSSISYEVAPPLVGTTLGSAQSFDFLVQVPDELSGESLTVALDIFDNGDAARSLAFVGLPQAVPEPGVMTLAALGLGIFFRRWMRRRA
jgi:hypothetical protein